MSSTSIIWIGMDVHKDTVMVAVFKDRLSEPEVVHQLPNELPDDHRTRGPEARPERCSIQLRGTPLG